MDAIDTNTTGAVAELAVIALCALLCAGCFAAVVKLGRYIAGMFTRPDETALLSARASQRDDARFARRERCACRPYYDDDDDTYAHEGRSAFTGEMTVAGGAPSTSQEPAAWIDLDAEPCEGAARE